VAILVVVPQTDFDGMERAGADGMILMER
jgi:hypothetical protein